MMHELGAFLQWGGAFPWAADYDAPLVGNTSPIQPLAHGMQALRPLE